MDFGEVILAHLVGDYLLQPDVMAKKKVKSSAWAAFHSLLYTLPFLFLTSSLASLSLICSLHFLIDRYSLGMRLSRAMGSREEWLGIVRDNILHLIVAWIALKL